jgi:hypothetical protein
MLRTYAKRSSNTCGHIDRVGGLSAFPPDRDYTPDKTIRSLGVEDTLEASELLPGFQLSVRAILQ